MVTVIRYTQCKVHYSTLALVLAVLQIPYLDRTLTNHCDCPSLPCDLISTQLFHPLLQSAQHAHDTQHAYMSLAE